ncbi:hypothetical protein [Kitasatospora kifunensis]|uniref:Uncharacterized protein n=1 Tax=Kitasatospora kifunensis TaxID=58351 RepID=A0A7W7RB26_KITKI|nr:hypothetical protein [Kitasatospora kifunensis]MBB4928580.1 hypothetical protein [Kitasatospora kifunensis]
MAGRHSHRPEPRQQPDGEADQRLRALTTGQPVIEEGAIVPDGCDRHRA